MLCTFKYLVHYKKEAGKNLVEKKEKQQGVKNTEKGSATRGKNTLKGV